MYYEYIYVFVVVDETLTLLTLLQVLDEQPIGQPSEVTWRKRGLYEPHWILMVVLTDYKHLHIKILPR